MALHESCHLITVIGGKGGVGKSVFAANLAFAMIKEMRVPTLLIDCDPKSCGDQNFITGIRPQKTVMDLAQFTGAITPQTLGQIVTNHASGVSFIGAVMGPDQPFSVQESLLKKQIFSLSQHFRYIIMDIGSELGELQMSMIEHASAIMVVTSPEVLVVNQTRRLVNDLMSASVPADFIQLVVNKASRSGVDPKAISQSLRRPILSLIPQDDVTAYAALQRSMPFVLAAPNTPLTAAYHDTVRKLTGGVLQKLKGLVKPRTKPTVAGGIL